MNIITFAGNRALIEPAIASYEDFKKKNPVTRAERIAMLKSTYGNRELAKEFAAHRVEKFKLTILPDLIISETAQMIPLEDDGRIEVDTTYSASYTIKTINEYGDMPKDEWVLKDSVTMYDVYPIKTDKVHYPIRSVVQGNINKSDEVNADLEFSYRNRLDSEWMTLWQGIFTAAFTDNTVYRLHPRVSASSIPTTNIVDASAEGALTVGAIKMLFAHCLKADVIPRVMYCNPTDMTAIWDWTPVVAGYSGGDKVAAADVLSLEKHAELMRSGKIDNLFGYPVVFKPMNTLSSGSIYVATNKPAGYFYYKPGMEKVRYWSEDECAKIDNKPYFEAVQMEGVIKPLIPAPLYLNSVRLDIV